MRPPILLLGFVVTLALAPRAQAQIDGARALDYFARKRMTSSKNRCVAGSCSSKI